MKAFSTLLVLVIISVTSAYPTSKYPWDVTGNTCPGGGECPDGQTCCPINSEKYGCCQGQDSVCCSDGEHCCDSGDTCCPTGCCPEENGVCCGDKKCCPEGYTCGSDDCVRPLLQAVEEGGSDVTGTCPDGGACPGHQTCCPINSEKYGCCKEPNAVCCSDGVHCCPHGDTCDLSDGTCNRNGYKTSMMTKLPTLRSIKTTEQIKVKPSSGNVATPTQVGSTCPDGGSCPNDQTCCPVGSGKYGCCKERNAVCCSDGRHCCPEGDTCDLSDGTCNRNGYKTSMMTKMLALPPMMETTGKKEMKVTRPLPNTVEPCPGSRTVGCSTSYTCCQVTGQPKVDYMCCRLPNAVCCTGTLYCCKHGQKCQGSSNDVKCTDGNEVVPATWLDQVEAAAGII